MSACVTLLAHLLTLTELMASTRRLRASICRDSHRGLLPRPLGVRGHAAR